MPTPEDAEKKSGKKLLGGRSGGNGDFPGMNRKTGKKMVKALSEEMVRPGTQGVRGLGRVPQKQGKAAV